MTRLLKYGIAAGVGFVAGTVYGAVKQKAFDEQEQQNKLEQSIPDEVLEEMPQHIREIVREHPEAIEVRHMSDFNQSGAQYPFGDDPFGEDDDDDGTDIDLQ